MTFIKSSYPRDFTVRDFKVGKQYGVFGRPITFIQSTNKGFDFIDHKNNKLLFLGYHLYDRNYIGKPLPIHDKTFRVTIHRSWEKHIREL